MFYVYVLYSEKLNRFYLGSTKDLKRRVLQHKQGETRSTKHASDWILSYYEAYLTEQGVKQREARLKRSGKAYSSLKQRIRESMTDPLSEGEASNRSPGKRRP